ncbi:MAG TPA: PspC domain-containing protein [Acidimicrobiia bacterium]|nr:PspC domain-containing protein [Acidimicrobiia bacterium]
MQSSESLRRRLVRPSADRRVAGVAAAVGNACGVDPNLLRVAFVVLSAVAGVGVALYVLGWIVLPSESGERARSGYAVAQRARPERAWDAAQALAVGAIVLGALLLLRQLRLGFVDSIVWPAAVAGVGVALLWRQRRESTRRSAHEPVDSDGRGAWSAAIDPLVGSTNRPAAVARVVVGAVLVLASAAAFLAANHSAPVRQVYLTIAVMLAGLGLVFGPWLYRLATDLSEERSERIRSQERAELAAHLHDSVLHTLALLRRSANDPREVVRLARRQERELRTWIAGRRIDPSSSLATAIDEVANDVEADHGVPIDVVKVGDCELDERLVALTRAAREAMVNASKHSRAASIAVYVEVDAAEASVFVRDRGVGFSLDDVAADRHGVAQSITGRMERYHGCAVVRTAPGAGTEVRLTMPRGGT